MPIGIVHPINLSDDERTRWAESLSDHEVIQPFAQIGRDVHTMTPEERNQTTFERFSGCHVAYANIKQLGQPLWKLSKASTLERRLPNHRTVVINVDVTKVVQNPQRSIRRVWLKVPGYRSGNAPFSELNTVEASELIRDIRYLLV